MYGTIGISPCCSILSSFNRFASPSRIWICYKCNSKNFSHFPFYYSQLYLTVSNSFNPLSDTNFTFEIDSFSSTTPFVPGIHSTPILNSPITLEPPVQNMTSTSTQYKPPPAFIISSSGPESPPSVLTPEPSSDFIYPKKGSNWRTVVINANSIPHKKAEISAMTDYCDPDLMLIMETKFDISIFSSELLPKGYVGKFRRDCNLKGGWLMIVTKDCYTITDLVLQTTPQNETELVWATITLKDHSKLVLFTDHNIKGSSQFWNWKVNYPRLRIPLGTTPKLLSLWAVILTQGYWLRNWTSA